MGQLGDLSPQGSVAVRSLPLSLELTSYSDIERQVGVIAGLISTSVQSLGLTLQRKSHILEDEKDSNDVRRPPHRRRRWQVCNSKKGSGSSRLIIATVKIGMFIFILSNIFGSTIQITTLPLPVLSTLQAV